MLDDQHAPHLSGLEQTAPPPPGQDLPSTQDATDGAQGSTAWGAQGDGAAGLNYRDYYWMMSLADFLAWIQQDDGSAPPISFSKT